MNRILSLVPAATEIVAALGFADEIVGRTHECDFPKAVENARVVTRSRIDVASSSREIDQAVRELTASQSPIFKLDENAVRALRPTLIFTQGLCPVCAIDRDQVNALASSLVPRPRVVELQPNTLDDVFEGIAVVGKAMGCESWADEVVRALKKRVKTCLLHGALRRTPPRVLLLEWLDPFFSAGHWNPELIGLAGGEPVLAKAGAISREVTIAQIAQADPDVIVLAPCGFNTKRAADEAAGLPVREGWASLRAVQEKSVYVVDGSHYFNRPGPRLVESLELLSGLIDNWAERRAKEMDGVVTKSAPTTGRINA